MNQVRAETGAAGMLHAFMHQQIRCIRAMCVLQRGSIAGLGHALRLQILLKTVYANKTRCVTKLLFPPQVAMGADLASENGVKSAARSYQVHQPAAFRCR